MKPLLLLILVLVVSVSSQTISQPPVKLKNWRERLYRNYKVEDVEAAQKRLAGSRDTLDRFRATPNMTYPEYLHQQEALVVRYQAELKAAESELAKVDEMLSDPEIRKAFNKEAQSIFKDRNQTIASQVPPSSYHPSQQNFRIDCYWSSYGRYVRVRCTSSWY